MSNDYELHRVKYYSEADLSAPFCVTRIRELLKDDPKSEGLTIDDAIELFQCHLVLTKCLSDEAKEEGSYSLLIERAEIRKGVACEVIRSHLEDCGLRKTYECVCRNYKDVLIGLIADVGFFSFVSREDVRAILEGNPECIPYFLTCKKLVKKYSRLLKLALVENPVIAARLIIDAKALRVESRNAITLPDSLTQSDVNGIFSKYIDSDNPHSGYLKVIAEWRTDWQPELYPEVKSAAENRANQVSKEMLERSHGGFKYGTEVRFCDSQKECLIIDSHDFVMIYRYGTEWINAHSDYPTLLNNLFYVFGLADRNCLLAGARPDNSHSVILDMIALDVKDSYKVGIGFNLEDMRTQGVIAGYRATLKQIGIDLESVIEWYFEDYVQSEYGVAGFRIDLPREGVYYTRCVSAFSQIERVLKAYSILIRLGEIDKNVFKYERFRGFKGLPSKIAKKYVIPSGSEYELAVWSLFSDQCMLAYDLDNPTDDCSCFFDRMVKGPVRRSDCPEYENQRLNWLIDRHLLIEDEAGILSPTMNLKYTWKMRNQGCLVYPCESAESREIIDALVEDGFFEFYSALLSPQESDYFSYFYHDKDFANAVALRNSYEHGHDLEDNPNDQVHIMNYHRALQLLLQLIIKIDNELSLSRKVEKGIQFIDWPFLEVGQGVHVLMEDTQPKK